MTETLQPADAFERVSGLCELLCTPTDQISLAPEPAGGFSKTEWKKISTSGLEVGNYGFGDESLFLRAGSDRLYPVIGEFPILLEPECIIPTGDQRVIDLTSPQYHEAYVEMNHYNAMGHHEVVDISERHQVGLMAGMKPGMESSGTFPDPIEEWIDAQHDSLSQYQAYSFLSNIRDRRFLQLGGSGAHCVKALLAGASEAILLTPMLGEALFAKALAEKYSVGDKLFCVIAVGEELPFKESSMDLIYSGGCLHHMRTELAFAEFKRVLKPKGRFACVDPWKTNLHKIGTKILGKREVDVFCKPIDPARLESVSTFKTHHVSFNGPVLRYFFLGLSKFGISPTPATMLKITKFENAIFSSIGLDKNGGSILITGEK